MRQNSSQLQILLEYTHSIPFKWKFLFNTTVLLRHFTFSSPFRKKNFLLIYRTSTNVYIITTTDVADARQARSRHWKCWSLIWHFLRMLRNFPATSDNLRQKPWNTLENSAPFCFPPPFCNVVVATQLCNNISTLQGERDVHRCFKDFWRGL